MASIFKAYDIRGVVGEALTEKLAHNIGRAFVTFLQPKTIVVGRDMRPHSDPLFQAFAAGANRQGADIIDIGLCSTPMNYFANGHLKADAGVMITASHNPGEYNGFKLCRAGAVPISGVSGIKDIERIILESDYAEEPATPGTVRTHDIMPAYAEHIRAFAKIQRPLKVAVDFANAVGVVEAKVLDGLPLDIDPLYDTMDGSFPNHEANPLDPETWHDLQAMVRKGDYDFGIAFDGDADRVGFCDENGEVVSMDKITALIAASLLEMEPTPTAGPDGETPDSKGVVFYDLRSSWTAKEVIEENGGTPRMCRVGHSFIKAQMREADALFAGELSGHYYFRENFYTESTALAILHIANLVSSGDRPFSEWVAPLNRYVASGEINSRVADAAAALDRIRAVYGDKGEMMELDGVSVTFPDRWLNVRMSNTEPLVRLNCEAPTEAEMAALRDELLAVIRGEA